MENKTKQKTCSLHIRVTIIGNNCTKTDIYNFAILKVSLGYHKYFYYSVIIYDLSIDLLRIILL